MSYKHANAVRVRSKAKGMHYLIFCELAALMHADGRLVDDQVKLVKMLKVGRSTLKRSIKNLEALGELERVPSKVRGIATEYRSTLGELESLPMHEHFRGLIDLVGGSERTPNAPLIGDSERTPNEDSEIIGGSERTIGGSERPTSGFTENPPKTLELSKTIEPQKHFYKSNSKAKDEGKGLTLDECLKKVPSQLELTDGCNAYKIGKQYGFNQVRVLDQLMNFKRTHKGSKRLSTNWTKEFEDHLTEHVMAHGTNGGG